MQSNIFEALIGAVVLVVAVVFFVFAFNSANVGTVQGYEVVAKFDRIDGLNVGADVRMSGIKIGTVVDQVLDPESYLAVVSMSIDPDVELPKDTSAQIIGDGLLGGKFMALIPGGDIDMIKPGGEITFTQGPMILDNLIGQLIFSAGGGDGDDD